MPKSGVNPRVEDTIDVHVNNCCNNFFLMHRPLLEVFPRDVVDRIDAFNICEQTIVSVSDVKLWCVTHGVLINDFAHMDDDALVVYAAHHRQSRQVPELKFELMVRGFKWYSQVFTEPFNYQDKKMVRMAKNMPYAYRDVSGSGPDIEMNSFLNKWNVHLACKIVYETLVQTILYQVTDRSISEAMNTIQAVASVEVPWLKRVFAPLTTFPGLMFYLLDQRMIGGFEGDCILPCIISSDPLIIQVNDREPEIIDVDVHPDYAAVRLSMMANLECTFKRFGLSTGLTPYEAAVRVKTLISLVTIMI